jgi:hypothetical protein
MLAEAYTTGRRIAKLGRASETPRGLTTGAADARG